MTEPRKLRVFLCHSSQDKPIVRELYQRLNTEGWIDPWLDEEKLLPGQDWDMEIEKAVEAADAVIVCLTNTSVKKEGYIQKELRFALNVALEKPPETIFIIPLRLDDCFVPRTIKSIQYIDFFPSNKIESAYLRLFNSLEMRANKIGVDIFGIQENIQRMREDKDRREREERIRKQAEEKIRYEEEKNLRKQAEENARLVIKEEARKQAEEKVRLEQERKASLKKKRLTREKAKKKMINNNLENSANPAIINKQSDFSFSMWNSYTFRRLIINLGVVLLVALTILYLTTR